jgi:hypothetical protein
MEEGMIRRTVVGGGFVALLLGCWAAMGGSQLPDKRPTLMRVKALHAQKLIEALTLEDFAAMAKHAQQMKLLSQEASWQVFQGDEYEQYSVAFRRATDNLALEASRRNLDGAVLSYFELTMNCVSCHKYVRDRRRRGNNEQGADGT